MNINVPWDNICTLFASIARFQVCLKYVTLHAVKLCCTCAVHLSLF